MLQTKPFRHLNRADQIGVRVGALFALAGLQALSYLGLQVGALAASPVPWLAVWLALVGLSWAGVIGIVVGWRRSIRSTAAWGATPGAPARERSSLAAPSRSLRLGGGRCDLWVAWATQPEPELEMATQREGDCLSQDSGHRFAAQAQAADAGHLLRASSGRRSCNWLSPRPR